MTAVFLNEIQDAAEGKNTEDGQEVDLERAGKEKNTLEANTCNTT